MKKPNPIFLLLLACCCSCGWPNHILQKPFIAEFKQAQTSGFSHQVLKNGVEADWSKSSDSIYIRMIVKPGYTNGIYMEFYNTGELRREGRMCCGFFWGKHKIYNKNGDAVSVTDYEKPYKVTLGNLDFKIATKFGLNIYKQGVQLSRTDKTDPPVYKLTIPITFNNKSAKRYIVVNANTGAIITNDVYEDIGN